MFVFVTKVDYMESRVQEGLVGCRFVHDHGPVQEGKHFFVQFLIRPCKVQEAVAIIYMSADVLENLQRYIY